MSDPAPRNPDGDAHILREVEAAVKAQNIPHAVDLARTALAGGFEHPMLLNLRSFWLFQQGREQDALADLARAVDLAPRDLTIRNDYGLLLGQHERWEEAFAILEGSVALAPDSALAQFGLGWARELTGELGEARRLYELALTLDPVFVEPMLRLASLAFRRGDWTATRELAGRALAHRPGDYVGLSNLAAAAVAQGDLETAEPVATRLVAARAPTLLDGAFARSVLGDVRHAQGRYSQAFSAYTAGNRDIFRHYAPRYDVAGSNASDYCAWLARYFAGADARQWSAKQQSAPDDSRDGAIGHVFLVGFPRSGTTLLENILASNPRIATLEEADTLAETAQAFLIDEAGRDRLAKLSASDAADYRARYWRRVRDCGAAVQGKVFIDKFPLRSIRLPLVAKLFPKAKVLFAVRDPRDVVLSCFRRSFAINPSTFELLHLERAARFYAAVMNLSAIYRAKLELDWHELRHEALVENFEGEARKACDFLGVEWSDQMAGFALHAKSRDIRTPSAGQVVQGLNSDGVGQWRHYEVELGPVMNLLKPWVEKFGYA